MNSRLLIDAIVQQTTVLIAQLSTAAGIRAPLAHIADQVFLELSREIERQGVSRKVAADMFGLALRGYQKRVVTDQGTQLRRAALVPGPEEVLAHTPEPETLSSSWVAIDVSDRGLFWADDQRIMRQVIEDYAVSPSPAQGAAGGPCFNDLSCDAGLACVNLGCE
jgi:hypothetical protein